MLLASLSCWIIFTLPLAFMQPPATSCVVLRNNTVYLESPNPKTRIVKRSTNFDEFYHRGDNDCLEVAANVVFERLRKNDDTIDSLNRLRLQPNKTSSTSNVRRNDRNSIHKKTEDLNNNRIRREASTESTSTEESPIEDLKYKQLVFEENANDPEAKTIDFETLQRRNRPADVLEYKRFLNVSFVRTSCHRKR